MVERSFLFPLGDNSTPQYKIAWEAGIKGFEDPTEYAL